jgi:hypothetical protein
MKRTERHHLKQNEFASSTARMVGAVVENRDRVVLFVGAALVILVIGLGYWFWQDRRASNAGALLGAALAVEQGTIAPPPTLPGVSQTPGTYPSEQARHEAALKAFQQVVDDYGSTREGLTAQYHVGVTLLALGRTAEADRAFQAAIDRAGDSIYGPMAKLGRAEVLIQSGKYDDAIKLLGELAADRDGPLPVDGVLMALARAYVKAGKPQDARATFKRVVDEFPESPYAGDARQQMTVLAIS